jgi:hypothetical protein
MGTKIILTIEEELTEPECNDLQLLLCDALSEFATRRSPAAQYVDERYPATNEGYNWVNRPEKVAQVQRRITLAQKLHKGVFDHVIDPEPRDAKRAYDAVKYLCETFGMSAEEARGTYNQLEDKRISKLMVEQGLVKS